MEPIANQDTGKTVGIVSYFTIIGWLVAYFGMHQNNKTALGSYQLRQTLLLHIVCIAIWIVWDFVIGALLISSLGFLGLASLVNFILWIGFLILWIIGLIGAVNGQQRPIPVIGAMAQNMFKGI